MTPSERSNFVKQIAMGRGFHICGIVNTGPIPRASQLAAWLDRGFAGSMAYLCRHRDSRMDLRTWIPKARSVVVVGLSYRQGLSDLGGGIDGANMGRQDARVDGGSALSRQTARRGRVAMYAWGEDYHIVVREKLDAVVVDLREQLGETFEARCCVDTSAIVERELAAAAGVGWIGKNGMVIHPQLGSFFVLGEIITDLDLAPDEPIPDHCGSCTRCLDACPTGALIEPRIMDARRCISYLTIEHREEITPDLTDKMGDWLFGCDVCQSVCPYNRRSGPACESRFVARSVDATCPKIESVLAWDEAGRRSFVRGKATDRATLSMWKRNAEIVERNLSRGRCDAVEGEGS